LPTERGPGCDETPAQPDLGAPRSSLSYFRYSMPLFLNVKFRLSRCQMAGGSLWTAARDRSPEQMSGRPSGYCRNWSGGRATLIRGSVGGGVRCDGFVSWAGQPASFWPPGVPPPPELAVDVPDVPVHPPQAYNRSGTRPSGSSLRRKTRRTSRGERKKERKKEKNEKRGRRGARRH